MTKITKIGNDGKEHEYWKLDEEDIKKRQEELERLKQQRQQQQNH